MRLYGLKGKVVMFIAAPAGCGWMMYILYGRVDVLSICYLGGSPVWFGMDRQRRLYGIKSAIWGVFVAWTPMDGGSGFACDDGPASHLPPTFTLLIPIKTYNTYKRFLARMKRIGN